MCQTYIHLLKQKLYDKYLKQSQNEYFKPENVSFTWNPMAQMLEKSFPSNLGQI